MVATGLCLACAGLPGLDPICIDGRISVSTRKLFPGDRRNRAHLEDGAITCGARLDRSL